MATISDFLGNMLGNVGGALLQPAKQYGDLVAQGAQDWGRLASAGANAVTGGAVGAPITGQEQPSFMTPQENQSYVQNPVGQTAKTLAGAESYAVPFGRGANIATKLLAPGAISAGLQEASAPNSTPQSVAGSAALGAAGAGVMGKGLPAIGKAFGAVGSGADKLGNQALRSQYHVTAKDAAQLGLNDTVSKLSRYGFRNINDVANAADKVTGDTGVITQLTRRAVANARPVEMGGLMDTAQQLIDDQPLVTEPVANKFKNMVAKGVMSSAGDNIQGGDPVKTFDFIKDLESKASTLGRGGDESRALGQAYYGVANELKDRLFQGAGADDALSSIMDPGAYEQLAKISPQLAQDAMGAKTVGQLRSLAAPFVRGSQLADASMSRTDNKIINPLDLGGGAVGAIAAGGPGALIGMGLAKGLESDAGKTLLGSILNGIGGGIKNVAGKVDLPDSNTLNQILGLTGATAGRVAGNLGSIPVIPGVNDETQSKSSNNPQHAGNTTTTNTISQPGSIASNQFGNYQKDANGFISLPTNMSQTPVQGYYPDTQYYSDLGKLNPSDPFFAQEKSVLDTKKSLSDQRVKEYISSHELNGEQTNFMQGAPVVDKALRSVDSQFQQLPPNILQGVKQVRDLQAYNSGQYAGLYSKVNQLQSLGPKLISLGAVDKDQLQAIMPQMSDSLPEAEAKIVSLQNTIADYYSQYYVPYTLINGGVPGVTSNDYSGVTQGMPTSQQTYQPPSMPSTPPAFPTGAGNSGPMTNNLPNPATLFPEQ